ncbi:MAG: ankyrin repeat domain-containing protein [Coxiellaceae bacterium]|nr:ankyrin repeat domain-containing protein [Coxiellaceae bacterium]
MPKWKDYKAITVEDLLATFERKDFERLIKGHLQLIVPDSGEGKGERFYAGDYSNATNPAYWAIQAGSLYYADNQIRNKVSLHRLTLSLDKCLALVEKASQSVNAYNIFYDMVGVDQFRNTAQEKHYAEVGAQLVSRLADEPKPLIDMVRHLLITHPNTVDHIVALLKNLKKYSRDNAQYRQLLNAQHEGHSVLDVLLAHRPLAQEISKGRYFELMDILHQYAKVPASPALIEKGLQWYSIEKRRFNHVLIWAADCPDNAMVTRLLADNAITRNADADYVYPDGKEMALHCALKNGADDAVVRQLVAQTKDLNHQDKWGYTPLMLAAKYNRPTAVKMLLRYQAVELRMNLRSKEGKTALHYAACADSAESLNLLLAQPHMSTALVNRLDDRGDSALAVASLFHHTEQVATLLAHRANIYSSNRQKQSPVDLAGVHAETLALLRPGEASYMECVEEKPTADVVRGVAVAIKPSYASQGNVNDRELPEYKQKVIGLLQKQMNGDMRFSRDVPVVRKHIDVACEAIEHARDLPAIHRVLDALHQRQVLWPEKKGNVTQRSYLRSTTVVQLKHIGFLSDRRITGCARVTAAYHGLFCSRRPRIGMRSQPCAVATAPPSQQVLQNEQDPVSVKQL